MLQSLLLNKKKTKVMLTNIVDNHRKSLRLVRGQSNPYAYQSMMNY